MSGNQSDLTGLSAKPKLITRYTSGTGTYVPTADMARCFVRVQGGGSGGISNIGVAGAGGAMVEGWVRVPIAGGAYVVGAGGGAGVAGGDSSFGPLAAQGGGFGGTGSVQPCGGILGTMAGNVNASGVTVHAGGVPNGVSGGYGGASSSAGGRIGHPIGSTYLANNLWPAQNFLQTNGQGISSGGDSYFGKGGLTNASPLAGNYGAGGGGGATPAAGLGGLVEIWDYGA